MRAVVCSVATWGLLGCASAIKPPPPPLATTTEEETVPAPRRPYAEQMPASRESPAAPALWVQLGGPSNSLHKLPTVAQALPMMQPLVGLDGAASPYGAAVASVIDLSQPVDIALDVPGYFFLFNIQPTWSFRVRAPEAVLQGTAGLTLQRVSAGVWNIALPPPVSEPLPEPDPDEEAEEEYEEEPSEEAEEDPGPSCQLRHLPEPVGFRVICGSSLERVNRDAPFLTAAARARETPLDLHAELGGPEYRKVTEQRQRYFDFTPAAEADATARAVTTLMGDVAKAVLKHDTLAVDAELKGERLLGQVELRFRPLDDMPLFNDWLAQSSRTPLPSSCAHLPRDGAFAACFSGIGPEPTRRLLDAFMTSLSEDTQVKARDFAEISAALSGILPPSSHFSVTCGVDAEAALNALSGAAVTDADTAERPLPPAAVTSLNEALGGWCAFAFDTPPDAYLAAAQRAYLANKIKLPRRVPEVNPRSRSTFKAGAVPAGLPTKSAHYVSQSRPNPKYKQETPYSAGPQLPFDMHLVLVPDGTRVWVVASRSEKLATARAKAALAPRDPAATWPELSAAAGKPGVGFLAIDFVSSEALDIEWDSERERRAARAKLQNVIVTSGRQHELVPFWLDVVPRQGEQGHNLRLRTDFPFFRVLGDLAVDVAGTD